MGSRKTRSVYRVNGMTLREISEKTGVPLDTIRHRYSRGIHDYKRLVRDDNLHIDEYRLEIACERGRRFLEAAIDKKITMKMVEERTGVARSMIWNFINNDADISSKRLAKLCACVGVSMDYVSGLKRCKDGNP